MYIRKCDICKKEFDLDDKNIDYFLVHNEKNKTSKAYHTCCYIDKETTKKKNPKTLEEVRIYVHDQKLLNKEREKKNKIKRKLNDYIQQQYNISFFPNTFFIKLAEIYSGTYKGLARPIPPEDLLDMWIRKQEYLDKVAESNKKKGKEFEPLGRANYDLAILLSKYDSYLAWKEKNKLANAENENKSIEKSKHQIIFDYHQISSKKENISHIDIQSILDEI